MDEKPEKLSVGFLYDDTLDSTDGVAQYVKTIGSWLSKNGHKVTYIAGETKSKDWQGGEIHSLSRNIKVAWGGNRMSIPLLSRGPEIKKLLAQKQLDIVHVQVPYSPFMAQKVINALNPKTALVGTIHVFPPNNLAVVGTKLLRKIYGKSLKRFDQFISVSTAAQTYAQKTLQVDSVVIPNAVDVSNFKQPGKSRKKGQQIVFLGRLVKRKGCKELLEAFCKLCKTNQQALLKIAGDGPGRTELESYVRKHKLADRVEFLGFIDEKDKAPLLASADIACFPSMFGESFGIVLIEAMAAGSRVVLGGDNPGYRTVLGQQPTMLIDPKNVDKFAQRLELLLSDSQLADQLHEWQQQEVKHYNVPVVANQLLKLYYQTIAKYEPRGHN